MAHAKLNVELVGEVRILSGTAVEGRVSVEFGPGQREIHFYAETKLGARVMLYLTAPYAREVATLLLQAATKRKVSR